MFDKHGNRLLTRHRRTSACRWHVGPAACFVSMSGMDSMMYRCRGQRQPCSRSESIQLSCPPCSKGCSRASTTLLWIALSAASALDTRALARQRLLSGTGAKYLRTSRTRPAVPSAASCRSRGPAGSNLTVITGELRPRSRCISAHTVIVAATRKVEDIETQDAILLCQLCGKVVSDTNHAECGQRRDRMGRHGAEDQVAYA